MVSNPDEWAIVAVGSWNPRVFQPEWVTEHLSALEVPEPRWEYLLDPAGPIAFRIDVDNLIIAPARERLVIGVRSVEDDVLVRAEELMRTILQLLRHTPVTALGVNLEFQEPEPSSRLFRLFELPDTDHLSDHRADIVRTEIRRHLQINGVTLNLIQTFTEEATTVRFNYHHPVTSAATAADVLDGERWLEHKESSVDLLTKLYDAHPQEGVLS